MNRLAILVGALLLGGALGVGGIDAYYGARNWSSMGPLPPGQRVPQFEVAMLEGGRFDAGDLEGKVSVVTFWATWCGACRSELPDLETLHRQFEGQPVQFVAVNAEGSGIAPRQIAPAVRRLWSAEGYTMPVALDDGSMTRTFRVGPIPHLVIFDKSGTLRHIHQGRVSSATLEDEIEALL